MIHKILIKLNKNNIPGLLIAKASMQTVHINNTMGREQISPVFKSISGWKKSFYEFKIVLKDCYTLWPLFSVD